MTAALHALATAANLAALVCYCAADALAAVENRLIARTETVPDTLPSWVDDGSARWDR